MATLSFIVFALYIVSMIPLREIGWQIRKRYGKDAQIIFTGLTAGIPAVVAMAMHYDMYGTLKDEGRLIPIQLLLLLSLCGLFVNAIIYTFLFWRARMEGEFYEYRSGWELPSLIFNGITLVASVLGIVGFYLQFLSS